jgi:hypothetical protein
MTPLEARNIIAKKHGCDSFDDLLVSFNTMKDGFELVHAVCDEAAKLYAQESQWYDETGKTTYKDLQGKTFEEQLSIRFQGWGDYGKTHTQWTLHSFQSGGADYGFDLIKRDDGYYLVTSVDSGYSNGVDVAGPLTSYQADNITDCFRATNRNHNDDPS